MAVVFTINFFKVRVGDVRVNLRRVDGGVAEELFDPTAFCALF